jgi:hypothetical protein
VRVGGYVADQTFIHAVRVHLLDDAARCAVGRGGKTALFGDLGEVGNGVGGECVGKAMGMKIENHGEAPWELSKDTFIIAHTVALCKNFCKEYADNIGKGKIRAVHVAL